jgi:RNA polymerase sigma-70 factor, ECF subfamily
LEAAEEIRLVVGAKHGDHASFEALVERYMSKAITVAMSYVGDRDEALDLAQEAFYRVYRTLDRFREGEPFAPWFYRILRNACMNVLAKQRRRRARSIHAADEDSADMPLPAGCLEPPAAAELGETRRQFWTALEQLPTKHREILLLRHFQELDYATIAEVLDIPIGTVMSRLFHARQSLRRRMEAYMEGRR